jgi:hypothetical protein
MHHNEWSHKSKGTDHGTSAWSVSKGMMKLPQDTCINHGPNTINTMPKNYIIWKMIQLSLSCHLFSEIEPSNFIKVLEYFKHGAALRESYKYWHNCSQISYVSNNMTCQVALVLNQSYRKNYWHSSKSHIWVITAQLKFRSLKLR